MKKGTKEREKKEKKKEFESVVGKRFFLFYNVKSSYTNNLF
jgi:hypothetical protein